MGSRIFDVLTVCVLILLTRYVLVLTRYVLVLTRYVLALARYVLVLTRYVLVVHTRYVLVLTRYVLVITRFVLVVLTRYVLGVLFILSFSCVFAVENSEVNISAYFSAVFIYLSICSPSIYLSSQAAYAVWCKLAAKLQLSCNSPVIVKACMRVRNKDCAFFNLTDSHKFKKNRFFKSINILRWLILASFFMRHFQTKICLGKINKEEKDGW